ncbi:MAG TPA: hypothetical protein VFH29_01130 [Anaerolineales bacterium]|nr:hypothetical protein [Anaerolineales bacterium]
MKILVFLHGTTIMHASAVGQTRAQRVQQVLDHDPSARDFASYVPTEAAVTKLRGWAAQGAHILYLSSHRKDAFVELDRSVLRAFGFPDGDVLHRGAAGTHAGIVEEVMPDILIEDDCESFGGQKNMAFPNLRPELQSQVKSIIVPEFGGLEHLPDDLPALSRV